MFQVIVNGNPKKSFRNKRDAKEYIMIRVQKGEKGVITMSCDNMNHTNEDATRNTHKKRCGKMSQAARSVARRTLKQMEDTK